MNYEFAALTDAGRTRENNEDSVRFVAAGGLGVLADGMGGYNAGEVASGMATAYIADNLGGWLAGAGEQVTARYVTSAMQTCVQHANQAIFNASNANEQYAGMGTTLVVGAFLQNRLVLGHIGDSRCYRWRGNVLTQLTRDHSLLQEQLDAGLISPTEAALSPHKNLVTRAMGVDSFVDLEVHEHAVEPNDVFLMCSDGLNDMIDDSALATLLSGNGSLEALAQRLVDSANACGGRDNISVLLANARVLTKRNGLMSRLLGK